jgi:predicted PurR-regulated permease PerM
MRITEKQDHSPRRDRREFLWRTITVIALVAAAILAWLAIDILLLVFGGILFAIFLRALSVPLERYTPLSPLWALTCVILILVALIAIGSAVVAPRLAEQFSQLGEALPEAIEEVRSRLAALGLGGGEGGGDSDSEALAWITGFFSGALTSLAYFLTFLFVGLFLAFSPRMYAEGTLALVPADKRDNARMLMGKLGTTLRWWLIGRALAMLMVGVSTTILMMIIGLPLAGLLGVIAGLLTFVPYLGPFVAGVPIVLVALMESPTAAIWAVSLYTGVQLIEGYIIDPLIQQKMVYLPPALTVAAQMMMGLLLGPLGIALATPLAAVALTAVKKTYVEPRP